MHVILGGTHGLGECLATQLQKQGQETFVLGRTYDETKHGKGMNLNLADPQSVALCIQALQKLVAFNFYWVAGYGYMGDFAEQPEPQKMADVNFGHVLPIAQAVWNLQLTLQEPSHFVVVSSTTGVKPRANEAVYAATKHAQVGFTRSLGLESERLKSNIRVALFMPGGMQTTFWEEPKPAAYGEFLDPAKVADKIIQDTVAQTVPFYECTIERGSL